ARSGVGQGEPIDILAQLTGSLQAPRVRLTSDEQPPISESDLASYLFFGVPTYALDITGDGSGGGLTNLGVGTLAPTVLGSAASLLQNLAQRYGLVDYVGLTAADNLVLPHQDRLNPIAGTNLEVGRYWGPLYVAATQRLDHEFQPGFRVEWTLNPTFTAEVDVRGGGLRRRWVGARARVRWAASGRFPEGVRLLALPGVELLGVRRPRRTPEQRMHPAAAQRHVTTRHTPPVWTGCDRRG